MRVAVCGTNSPELLNKVERFYKVESVGVVGNIYDMAKVTYDFDDVANVVFNGCALDCATKEMNLHMLDEQIVLCSLDNLDVVYVCTTGMNSDEIAKYHQFDEFFKGRVIDVANVDEFAIE